MAPRLSERKQAVLFAAILMAAIAGLYAATQLLQPAPVQAYVVRAVRLEIDGAGWTIRYDPSATPNNTVFSLLLEASNRLGFPVEYVPYQIPQGMFVTAINGSVNWEDGHFWQYWVNGAYGHIASDYRALHDGDAVLWKFDISREGA